MSQENVEKGNVETVNRVVEAFNTSGLDAALAYVHPELAWHAPPEWLEEPVYRGREGLRQLAESWGQNFDEYRLDLERVVDLGGNRALALLVQRGETKAGGNPMQLAIGWIVEVVDGQLARVDVHFSWASALEAAGLSE
jgi:ketosteroid isomerase-like protein